MIKRIFYILVSLFLLLPSFAKEDRTIILPSQIGVVKEVNFIDMPDESFAQVKQSAKIKLLSGDFKNEEVELDNMLTGNPYYDINLRTGMKVILHAEDNGNGVEYSIADIKRSNVLVLLCLIFCGLLIYVGRKKGIASLASIALTVILITHVLSPLILWGINPVIAASIVCILSTIATMYLVGGANAKSTSAVAGTLLSIVFAGILAFITIKLAHLTGVAGENSLFLYSAQPQLNFVLLTIAAIMLATLGAVMDVSMSISSTINELLETDNNLSVKALFLSGMNVGRDIIGTMANTLILVYIGGALPLLLLANNIDMQKFVNLNQVVTEIAAALIGSISLVLCVPITAIVASYLIKKLHNKNSDIEVNINCV